MLSNKNIIDALKIQGIDPDIAQKEFIDIAIRHQPKKIPFLSRTFWLTNNKNTNNGIYLWGEVGRGKTLILKTFFENLQMKKKEFHYIDFMNLIHSKLDDVQGRKNPLESVVNYLDRNYEVIFIDEFQVEDVADAMILANIIKILIKKNIYLYLSSNAHPDDLYKNGLQRKKFIEAMKFMQTKLLIHKLIGQNDYRLLNIFKKTSVNSTAESNKAISYLISKNFSHSAKPRKDLHINSRSFTCSDHGNEFVWLSFNEFFSQPTAANDFKEICSRFEWVFINDFNLVDDSRLDIVRRFISFIDIAYAKKLKIKFFFEKITPENIYSGVKLDLLWGRCSSRLQEMQTSEYLNSKKN